MTSRSASERLLQHLGASPQKSLLESRRVAPGTPLGHMFEARGRLFHGKIAARMHFYQISVRFCNERRFCSLLGSILDRFFSKKMMGT